MDEHFWDFSKLTAVQARLKLYVCDDPESWSRSAKDNLDGQVPDFPTLARRMRLMCPSRSGAYMVLAFQDCGAKYELLDDWWPT